MDGIGCSCQSPTALLDSLQQLFNICLNINGEEISAVTLVGLPVGSDQELLKVPGDVVPTDGAPNDELWIGHESHSIITGERKLFLQIYKQGVGILSIDVHLLKELELGFEGIPRTDVLQRL